MDKLAAGIVVAMIAAFVVFAFAVFGALFGAFAGWAVSMFFDAPIKHVLTQGGIVNVELWQVGATAGFIGSFFKTVVSKD